MRYILQHVLVLVEPRLLSKIVRSLEALDPGNPSWLVVQRRIGYYIIQYNVEDGCLARSVRRASQRFSRQAGASLMVLLHFLGPISMQTFGRDDAMLVGLYASR